MKEILDYCQKEIKNQHFDCLAVGVIDFKKSGYDAIQLTENNFFNDVDLYFDLASLTKPLSLGVAYLSNESKFSQEMLLLLDHRSGLPSWGRLSRDSWQDQVLSYSIKESGTSYSDFGALRLQLEIEKATGKSLYEVSSPFWDEEVKHWTELGLEFSPFTGTRNKKIISGIVHDDNAFVIGSKLGHAGLFGTIQGLCETLIKINNELNLVERIGKDHNHRFHLGWDTVENLENTLAGKGCSKNTFGHLGFTGTSIWIDPEKNVGHIILTNETVKYWYDRKELNRFRREIGQRIFSNFR